MVEWKRLELFFDWGNALPRQYSHGKTPVLPWENSSTPTVGLAT